ncbi:type I-E CRISPR-associated protein Cas7/Cse4/CasC [Salinibacter ruber]|uniref:CRISPR system Cascade subunit CasC n=1 Tax=Salinibacter ruber TaxID=146919 RepID=A0A9X2UNA9_9BACT|nr:type I-E CRISPR-associated protein Cas7/Cse4/CasC [Salinibacter ruber]MCS4038031.1 CRISPR system Cascade subunit CasC [Salinibacter ruber]
MKFISYHLLTPYRGALLNRDDAGFAKTIPVGSTVRTRVSSQCIKYHLRNHEGPGAIRDAGDMSIRSRQTFRKKIAEPLAKHHPTAVAAAVTAYLKEKVLDDAPGVEDVLESDDPMSEFEEDGAPKVLGSQEVSYLRDVAADLIETAGEDPSEDDIEEAAKNHSNNHPTLEADLVANLEALSNAIGIDGAMFGRMVTSDVLSRVNSAVHVAHAHTVQEQQRESDYFTAIDQLKDGSGSAHNGSKELTSGLYYQFMVIDTSLLRENLGDPSLAEEVVRRFTSAVARVSIGAKKGSTAPYSLPIAMLVKAHNVQPFDLHEAFVPAVEENGEGVYQRSAQKLFDWRQKVNEAFGTGDSEYRYVAPVDVDTDLESARLPELAEWTSNQIS